MARLTHDQVKWVYLLGALALFIASAFLWQDWPSVWQGLWSIWKHPSLLTTDYVLIGGIGGALMNAASVLAGELLLIRLTHHKLNGRIMAAVFFTIGFSLFGTNPFNTLPIVLGTLLYARCTGKSSDSVLFTALMSSALGPLVSVLAFDLIPLHGWRFLIAYAVGILSGFLLPILAEATPRFHQGYTLYNVGFAAGLLGMTLTAVMRHNGLSVAAVSYLSDKESLHLTLILSVLFLYLLICGIAFSEDHWQGYLKLLKSSGHQTDFETTFGTGLSMINMGVMGLLGLAYVWVFCGHLNGPVAGSILAMVSFSAFGKHPLNVLPVLTGVTLAALTGQGEPTWASIMVTALFSTALAPIAGRFGFVPGVLAGYLHTTLVTHTLYLCGGMNLYNNGFATGFVAAVLAPICLFVEEQRKNKRKI